MKKKVRKVDKPHKVNKPRLSLRKRPLRRLYQKYRGVVPSLLHLGVPEKTLMQHGPETLLALLGMFMKNEDYYKELTKRELAWFRKYLKEHEIEDWTQEESNAKGAHRPAARTATGTARKGR